MQLQQKVIASPSLYHNLLWLCDQYQKYDFDNGPTHNYLHWHMSLGSTDMTEKTGKIWPKPFVPFTSVVPILREPWCWWPLPEKTDFQNTVSSAHFCITRVQYKPGRAGIYTGFVTFPKRPSCLGPQKPVKGNWLWLWAHKSFSVQSQKEESWLCCFFTWIPFDEIYFYIFF